MSTRGGGRVRGGRGMTSHGITPHGVTTRSVLTPAVQFMPNNEQNSSAALHISESEQPNESLAPEDAPVTKQVRGRTKGLALAKIRRCGEKVKLGFSRMLGQPTSENEDDLTRYTIELGVIVRQFAPLQAKSWAAVPRDAKEMFIAHIREKFDLPETTYVDKAILQSMGKRYYDSQSRLKTMFEKGVVDCPAHIEGADWTYLCNLWQDKDYKEKCNKYKVSRSKPRNHHVAGSKAFYKVKNHLKQLKDVQDQAMANGSVPLTDEELSCTVFGPKSGYIRGLGHGPKPSLTKFSQASRAQLIRDAKEARMMFPVLKLSFQVQETGVTCWKLGLIDCSTNDGDLFVDENAIEY
ncbi:hypothetical protein RHGRI_025407 [Rhododendron griersonianum]|uniref:Transposase n=1 Tax=Rhododendron griersonianum TaxID=479676 RepID=A0AAV6IUE2_9ERIC|nr:hypothetical protein RHGRI_025407 [Rhododendron griersonianum]